MRDSPRCAERNGGELLGLKFQPPVFRQERQVETLGFEGELATFLQGDGWLIGGGGFGFLGGDPIGKRLDIRERDRDGRGWGFVGFWDDGDGFFHQGPFDNLAVF